MNRVLIRITHSMITCFFHETGYLIQGVFLREKKSFSHRFFWLTATLVMIWPHSCIGTCIWSIFKITPTRIDVMFALVFLRSSVTVYNLHLRILTYTDQGLSMYSCCIQSIASPFQRLPCKQMLLCKKRARLAHSKTYYQNLLKLSLKESFFFFFCCQTWCQQPGNFISLVVGNWQKKSYAAAPSFSRNGKAIKLIGG